MRNIASCAWLLLGVVAPAAFGQTDEADRETIEKILTEIELAPSLYAKGESLMTAKTAPKFSSSKLSGYSIGPIHSLEKERQTWAKDKEKYASEFPMRAALLEAAAQSKNLTKLDLFTSVGADFNKKGDLVSGKNKRAFLQNQASVGVAIFELESILAQMKDAAEKRDQEKNVRWKADFDFAQTRVQGNIVFLYEYNFAVGAVRADILPNLGKEHIGWKIAARPKITVTESRAKALVKDRERLLKKIQEDHPGTPWAYFAERDSKRLLGMTWEPMKK